MGSEADTEPVSAGAPKVIVTPTGTEPAASPAVPSGAALPTTETLPAVLTPEEAARLLRMRPRSIYEAIRRQDIPGVRRIGRKVRLDRDTLLKWLANGQGRVSRSTRR